MIFNSSLLIIILLFIKFVDSNSEIYCEEGSYCSYGSCYVCPVGTFRSFDSTSPCTTIASDSCQLCPTGTYQCMKNSTTCNLCSAGKYNSQIGSSLMSSCKSCPENTFSNDGASVCLPCPVGLGSRSNSSSCQPVGNFLINILMFILFFLFGLVLYISYMIIYKRHEIDRNYVSLHTAEAAEPQRNDIEMTNTN